MENIKLQIAVPRDILSNIWTQVRLFQSFQDSCLQDLPNLCDKDHFFPGSLL